MQENRSLLAPCAEKKKKKQITTVIVMYRVAIHKCDMFGKTKRKDRVGILVPAFSIPTNPNGEEMYEKKKKKNAPQEATYTLYHNPDNHKYQHSAHEFSGNIFATPEKQEQKQKQKQKQNAEAVAAWRRMVCPHSYEHGSVQTLPLSAEGP